MIASRLNQILTIKKHPHNLILMEALILNT